MAIRNNGLGGTDWINNEVMKSVDVNDTFDVLTNKVQTLTAFWMNPALSEKIINLEDDFTIDDNLFPTYSSISGTTIREGTWTNEDNFFDGNTGTSTGHNTLDNYLGKTFPSKYVYAVMVKGGGGGYDTIGVSLEVTYNGTDWTGVQSHAQRYLNFDMVAKVDAEIQGVRLRISTIHGGSINFYALSLVETKNDGVNAYYKILGGNQTRTITANVKNFSGFPDGIETRVIEVLGTAATASDGRDTAVYNYIEIGNLNENKHFFFQLFWQSTASIQKPLTQVRLTSSKFINFQPSTSGSASHLFYFISKDNGTMDIYQDGFLVDNINKEDFDFGIYSSVSGGGASSTTASLITRVTSITQSIGDVE